MLSRFEPGNSPTLLLLHGTGGDENDLVPLGQLLRPGAALLSPRGQILENGQPRFFRRLAPGLFDEDDLIRRTHELAEFVEDHLFLFSHPSAANSTPAGKAIRVRSA